MRRTEQVERLAGQGRIRLNGKDLAVAYHIRVFQDFDGNVPTQKSAAGHLKGLGLGELMTAMAGMKPLELELEDGRKTQILLKSQDGAFQVTGPIA